MRPNYLACSLLAVLALTGCARKLDSLAVREFIDKADDAARHRYAPEICELRGENFTLRLSYTSLDSRGEPAESEMNRKLYCREAGKFSNIRQYRLERTSLRVDIAPDRKTANVVAEYKETLPSYGYMPVTPDDFQNFVIVESRDESVVGFESGDIVFLEANVRAREVELVPKNSLDIPYE